MTFEEAMLKHKGTWDGDFALIKDRGYTFKVAKKTDAGIELMFDAKRFVTVDPVVEVPVEKPAAPKRAAQPRKGAVIKLDDVPAPTEQVDLDPIPDEDE